jgi:hypothetical protein
MTRHSPGRGDLRQTDPGSTASHEAALSSHSCMNVARIDWPGKNQCASMYCQVFWQILQGLQRETAVNAKSELGVANGAGSYRR